MIPGWVTRWDGGAVGRILLHGLRSLGGKTGGVGYLEEDTNRLNHIVTSNIFYLRKFLNSSNCVGERFHPVLTALRH